MKKKLVFHFYADENWCNNRAVRIHLKCLKHYSYVFDEVLIVLSISNELNSTEIYKIKEEIIKAINVPVLTIKTVNNTPLREAKTFYDEVVLGDTDNYLIFFGHTKGYTNYTDDIITNSVDDWIIGLYFLSLEYYEEAEKKLCLSTRDENSFFFGSFCQVAWDGSPSVGSSYAGSFFWLNMGTIKSHLTAEYRLPPLNDRYYAEFFPGLCYGPLFPSSHNNKRTYENVADCYGRNKDMRQTIDLISFYCDGDISNFLSLKEKILSEI